MPTDEQLSCNSRNRHQAGGYRWLTVAAVVAGTMGLQCTIAAAQEFSPYVEQPGVIYGTPEYVGAPGDYGSGYVSPAQYRELVPANREGYRRPLRRGVRSGGITPYFRVNYMLGDFESPGDQIVGAEQAMFTAPNGVTEDDIYDVEFGGLISLPDDSPFFTNSNARARSVRMSDFTPDSVNGIEGVIGIPLDDYTVELSAFTFEQVSARKTFRPEFLDTATAVVPAIPFFEDGVPAERVAIPFEELTLSYSSDFWGGGAIFELPEVSRGFSPTLGFRYLEYREGFQANGTFRQVGNSYEFGPGAIPGADEEPLPPLEYMPYIRSDTRNRIFGPTIGCNLALEGRWVTLTARPIFGLAVNRATTRVSSRDLFDTEQVRVELDTTREVIPGESSSTETRESELAPFLELELGGRVHVNRSFDLFLAYKLFALTRVLRAEEQIFYDSQGNSSNIGPMNAETELVIQSLMVGGEYRFGTPSTGR